jgi:putative hydrolase of the HAD superfamily
MGGTLVLRAVVFDYGMVLTGLPDREAHAAMMRLTGLQLDRFESYYWADRHALDEGKLTGFAFWQKLLHDAGLKRGEAEIEELNQWDARMWTTQNPAMLDWQLRLKASGLLTAILSNMSDNVLARIEREFAWIDRFDVLVWSFQLHMAKPDPAIYWHTLKELGTEPGETLFLDDRLVNVEAARALGMKAIHFSTVEHLRRDLAAEGLDGTLPLP